MNRINNNNYGGSGGGSAVQNFGTMADQPISGVEAFNFPEQRQNVPRQSEESQPRRNRANGNASYNERPFTDLVDEEKRPFVKRRVLSTLLGGYRTAFDDADDESSIPIHLHIS